jgi:uncharacterized membrane protein YciS (DUF1049 family)
MKAMVIKESDGEKFIGKLSSLVKIVYTVGTAVIGIIVWLMVMRSDVNANTKANTDQDKQLIKIDSKMDIQSDKAEKNQREIIQSINELKVLMERKQDKK